MLSKTEIGQLLSGQVSLYCSGRKLPMIEPEPFDDEAGSGFDPLTRWGDRKFKAKSHDWRD